MTPTDQPSKAQEASPTEADARQELQDTLRELHGQLGDVSDPDSKTVELLDQVRADLDRVHESTEEDDDDESLLDRFEDAAVEFSSEHPVLAQSLRRIVNLLNGLGI